MAKSTKGKSGKGKKATKATKSKSAKNKRGPKSKASKDTKGARSKSAKAATSSTKKSAKSFEPKTTKSGKPKKDTLPSTLQRSGDKAQETFAKTHDSAAEQYGDAERAHRTAFSALKHTHEKVGDHWEPKDEYGPSDAQAAGGADTARPTAGGVDANATKAHLLGLARRLDVPGRSTMNKAELVKAVQKANNRESAKALRSSS